MKILVACEESGVTRRALRARGHDAWSCDRQESSDRSPYHIVGDALSVARWTRRPHNKRSEWDGMIFHAPCTFTANSGAKWLYIGGQKKNGRDEDRWSNMRAGVRFFLDLWNMPIDEIIAEWPIIHEHAVALMGGVTYTQIIQPWQFGHKAMKATCIYAKSGRRLVPTNVVGPPPKDPVERKKWAVIHNMAPSPDRQKLRSKTFPGIGDALADQYFGSMSDPMYDRGVFA